ncbi:MAG: hypothetical protein ABJP89_19570 [Lentilitoribacter sp.]
MITFETAFEAHKADPNEGPWCLMIDGKVYGPFACYGRGKAIIAGLDCDGSKLYFQLIWSQGWRFWDSIYSYYTDFPIPTTARPSREPSIPIIKFGRIVGFKEVDADASKFEFSTGKYPPCPRLKVIAHGLKCSFISWLKKARRTR